MNLNHKKLIVATRCWFLAAVIFAVVLAVGFLNAQDLSTNSWRMWPDTNAAWANDPLYFPDQVMLSNMPSNAAARAISPVTAI